MADVFWGFVLRLGQVGIEAALPIVVGVMTAGVLRRMVGPAGTRKLFGRGWKGLVRGWIAGKLLPVCSLGVIPVSRPAPCWPSPWPPRCSTLSRSCTASPWPSRR